MVVFRNLSCPGVIGAESLENSRYGEAANRELFRAFQEIAAGEVAMDVKVEEVEQLLREIGRFFPLHAAKHNTPRCLLRPWPTPLHNVPGDFFTGVFLDEMPRARDPQRRCNVAKYRSQERLCRSRDGVFRTPGEQHR